ncbi:hypothetical protein ASG43_17645 [Aureimonas sp. Leaf454]|uniref:hypothetical protein n=1 Tax=Aureimonas sp. Leaf454 TaxID=1736381 RepID=UPI0006FA30F0|nr:hypothetical protein [Aureimonas sp. Leaf454]KQT53662.1 hypothetical protein ASG43_17645 [Aureimonas sp. Leaf454]
MSSAPQILRQNAEQFAQELFQSACDELVILAYGGQMHPSDVFSHFGLFRERGAQITEQAQKLPSAGLDDRLVWRTFARAHYSDKVRELFQKMLTDWKGRAPPETSSLFDDTIAKNIPVASLALVFPEMLTLRASQIDALRRIFMILAGIAGLVQEEKPATLPGLA